MAQAHHRIQPVQVANLATAGAAPGAFEGALAVDAPVPLVGPLCGEDAYSGHVQWHLNAVVPRDAPRAPVPRLSLQGAPSLSHTCSPSRQFRESHKT